MNRLAKELVRIAEELSNGRDSNKMAEHIFREMKWWLNELEYPDGLIYSNEEAAKMAFDNAVNNIMFEDFSHNEKEELWGVVKKHMYKAPESIGGGHGEIIFADEKVSPDDISKAIKNIFFKRGRTFDEVFGWSDKRANSNRYRFLKASENDISASLKEAIENRIYYTANLFNKERGVETEYGDTSIRARIDCNTEIKKARKEQGLEFDEGHDEIRVILNGKLIVIATRKYKPYGHYTEGKELKPRITWVN